MMWMQVFQSVWKILQNPTVIVAVIGALLSAYLWVGNVRVESKLTKANAEIVTLTGNLSVAKTNETTYNDLLKKMEKSQENLNMSVKALQKQVRDEQATTEKWIKFCTNKPQGATQVPSGPYIDKGVVVDDKASVEYVDFINNMFKSK